MGVRWRATAPSERVDSRLLSYSEESDTLSGEHEGASRFLSENAYRVYTVVLSILYITLMTGIQYSSKGPPVIITAIDAAPLLASLILGPLLTALVSGWGVVSTLVLVGEVPDGHNTVRVGGSLCILGFAVLNSLIRRRREGQLSRVQRVAAVAQSTILRPLLPTIGPVKLAGGYVSSTDDALVGGDLYDVIPVGDGVRFLVGDVRGKGITAVQRTATALWAFRSAASDPRCNLVQVAEIVEHALIPELSDEDFVTAVLCHLQPDGTLQVVNYGHPNPLILRSTGELVTLQVKVSAPPLGVALGTRPSQDTFLMGVGDRLVLYTDGLIEARDERGRFFPLEQQVRQIVPAIPLSLAVSRLMMSVDKHTSHHLADDVAVVLAELLPRECVVEGVGLVENVRE